MWGVEGASGRWSLDDEASGIRECVRVKKQREMLERRREGVKEAGVYISVPLHSRVEAGIWMSWLEFPVNTV